MPGEEESEENLLSGLAAWERWLGVITRTLQVTVNIQALADLCLDHTHTHSTRQVAGTTPLTALSTR